MTIDADHFRAFAEHLVRAKGPLPVYVIAAAWYNAGNDRATNDEAAVILKDHAGLEIDGETELYSVRDVPAEPPKDPRIDSSPSTDAAQER